MPLLHGTLALHDPRCTSHQCTRLRCVQDTERFCRTALDTEIRRRQITRIDYDDALAYLIEEAWWLAQRYDPQRSSSISTYVYTWLPDRFTNWLHLKLGRNPEHQAPSYLEDEPEQALGTGSDDPTTRLDPDLVQLLRARPSDTAQAIDRLGKATARRARKRTRRTRG
jgi:hypothetical protein